MSVDTFMDEIAKHSGIPREALEAEIAPRLERLARAEVSIEDVRLVLAEMVQEALMELKDSLVAETSP